EVGALAVFEPAEKEKSITTARLKGERGHVNPIGDHEHTFRSCFAKQCRLVFADRRNPYVRALAHEPAHVAPDGSVLRVQNAFSHAGNRAQGICARAEM